MPLNFYKNILSFINDNKVIFEKPNYHIVGF